VGSDDDLEGVRVQVNNQIQESLITLLMYDEDHHKVIAALVEPGLFDSIYKNVAQKALDYYAQWKQVPGEQTLDMFTECAEEEPDREELYVELFKSVQAGHKAGGMNPHFIIRKAREFVDRQVFHRALGMSFRKAEAGTPESLVEAKAIMSKAMERRADVFDPGLEFGTDVKGTLKFMDAEDEAYPMGIKEFDERNLGPGPGELWCLAASTGKGKSWMANHLSKTVIQHAHSPVILTLEMNRDKYAQRLVQTFFGYAKRPIPSANWVDFIKSDDPEDFGTMTKDVRVPEPRSLQHPGIRSDLIQEFQVFKDRPPFFVQDFGPRTLTIEGLELYLDMLERSRRHVPSLLVVDYADLMKLPQGMEKHEALEEVFIHLRRIAYERQIAVATFAQTKVSAARKKRVYSDDTGGAWAKVATCDKYFTYAQTEMEKKRGLCRIRCEKGRGDEDGFEVLVAQNYALGQFAMSTTMIGSRYWDEEDAD
jgi:hypothetical protein